MLHWLNGTFWTFKLKVLFCMIIKNKTMIIRDNCPPIVYKTPLFTFYLGAIGNQIHSFLGLRYQSATLRVILKVSPNHSINHKYTNKLFAI